MTFITHSLLHVESYRCRKNKAEVSLFWTTRHIVQWAFEPGDITVAIAHTDEPTFQGAEAAAAGSLIECDKRTQDNIKQKKTQ